MISMLVAAAVSFVVTASTTPIAIRFLRKRNIGQFIREDVEGHSHKHGTPTMGGVVMIGAVTIGYFVSHLSLWTAGVGFDMTVRSFTPGGLLALFAFIGMGVIGFLDDWSKVRAERNLGLNKRAKAGGQLIIASAFTWGAWAADIPFTFGFVRPIWEGLPLVVFAVLVLFMLVGAANAVNLTDGLDGLVAGSGALSFGAYS
ncbi:MAG: phospho-N-acetylmuramoyl-pentapeptide-transferase, partial [Acidimicrobiia bacterium]